MNIKFIDTNVFVRFFTENPGTAADKFKGVYSFFKKIETGETAVEVPEVVAAEVYYVLRRNYNTPREEAAQKLHDLFSFKGILMRDKDLLLSCFKTLQSKNMGLVDAYLLAASKKKGIHSIYSFDSDLSKHGLHLNEIS